MDLLNIKEFSKDILMDDTTGHDWPHALRVEENARKITPVDLSAEDLEIIRASCWLHDTIDEKIADSKRQTIVDIQRLLQENKATEEQIDQILFIIQNLSFSKNIDQKIELSLLGQIVQDADRLDAIGAIGIARTFYYGGSQRDPLYNEDKPRAQHELTSKNYRQSTSIINHFYEKLLIIEQQMNTILGTKEAKKRTKFMHDYLDQFFQEIQGL